MAANHDNTRIKFLIKHGNRIIVTALSFAGLYWDGFNDQDVLFGLSILLWLWLPEIDKLEENCICNNGFIKKKYKRTRQKRISSKDCQKT